MFDMAIFMKDGKVFYHGDVAGLTTYFTGFGYVCPNNYNPSDFVMHLSQTEEMSILEAKGNVPYP